MKHSKSMLEYLPKPDEDIQLVQAKISISLFEAANKARHEDRLLWKDLIEAGLKKYLDDRKVS